MPNDRYVKCMLTVIAICLVWIAIQQTRTTPLQAQEIVKKEPLQRVVVAGWESDVQPELRVVVTGWQPKTPPLHRVVVTGFEQALPASSPIRPIPVVLTAERGSILVNQDAVRVIVENSGAQPLPVGLISIGPGTQTWDPLRVDVVRGGMTGRPGQ